MAEKQRFSPLEWEFTGKSGEGALKGPCGSGFRVGDIRMNSCIYNTDTELHSDIVTGTCAYTCISSICQLRGPRTIDTPTAASTPRAQTLVSDTILSKRNQDSLKKWRIPGLGQETHKISLWWQKGRK